MLIALIHSSNFQLILPLDLVDLPACCWNNEMKPDRVSCFCFECKQFSHFHHGPRYKY